MKTSSELADLIPHPVWTAGADGRVEFVNEPWRTATGMDASRAAGDGWIEAVHPEDRNAVRDLWKRRLRDGRPLEREARLRAADGTYRRFLLRGAPLRSGDGSPCGWIATWTDIEDVKRAQDALEERDRRKDEFIANLAIELRRPLAPIRSSLDILRIAGGTGAAADRAQSIMERQLATLVRLVDDLLEIPRSSGMPTELRRERVDLRAVIHVAVETSRPLIESAGHRLHVTVPPEPLTMSIDPVRVAQVISTLLGNAATFTPPGGEIWLTAQDEADDRVISVRDTGVGLAPEAIPSIFELFAPAERRHPVGQGSLGIGLALARSLVEKHGGRIEARSEGRGKGSEFVVRLPRLAERRSTPTAPPIAWSGIQGLRVLVVDDSRDSADSLGILLRHLGAETQVVYDGLSALEAMRGFQPAVVFLDIGMPGMDGYETARRIRSSPEGREISLVALTGWGQDEDRRRSKAEGFARHLLKPVDADALRAVLLSFEAPRREGAGGISR
ncbi:MAG TPA: ATP-binding protein [Candidatus Eisenbacteria bacterium]|nr:ATP-binding protein [Candidatus Eisenbacteria bacterium]